MCDVAFVLWSIRWPVLGRVDRPDRYQHEPNYGFQVDQPGARHLHLLGPKRTSPAHPGYQLRVLLWRGVCVCWNGCEGMHFFCNPTCIVFSIFLRYTVQAVCLSWCDPTVQVCLLCMRPAKSNPCLFSAVSRLAGRDLHSEATFHVSDKRGGQGIGHADWMSLWRCKYCPHDPLFSRKMLFVYLFISKFRSDMCSSTHERRVRKSGIVSGHICVYLKYYMLLR